MNLIKRNQFIFWHLWISCNLPKRGCTHAHSLYKISNEKKRNICSQELSHSLLSNCNQYQYVALCAYSNGSPLEYIYFSGEKQPHSKRCETLGSGIVSPLAKGLWAILTENKGENNSTNN